MHVRAREPHCKNLTVVQEEAFQNALCDNVILNIIQIEFRKQRLSSSIPQSSQSLLIPRFQFPQRDLAKMEPQ